MPQELEIEFKNLLTKEEFTALCSDFNIQHQDFFKQTNTYFDTENHCLEHHQSALRIRTKDGKKILTLKQAVPEGMLETHQLLTSGEHLLIFEKGICPSGEIQQRLQSLCHDSFTFKNMGTLTTYRHEHPFKEGILVLDHSFYSGKEDYELEYEVQNATEGREVFETFLKDRGIPKRITPNKIARLYKTL